MYNDAELLKQPLLRQLRFQITDSLLKNFSQCMLRMSINIHQGKVFDSIICPDAIKVVHNFILFKFSADLLFHYIAMFKKIVTALVPSWHKNCHISTLILSPATIPLRMIFPNSKCAVTRHTTDTYYMTRFTAIYTGVLVPLFYFIFKPSIRRTFPHGFFCYSYFAFPWSFVFYNLFLVTLTGLSFSKYFKFGRKGSTLVPHNEATSNTHFGFIIRGYWFIASCTFYLFHNIYYITNGGTPSSNYEVSYGV
jgi:hypothetical protein